MRKIYCPFNTKPDKLISTYFVLPALLFFRTRFLRIMFLRAISLNIYVDVYVAFFTQSVQEKLAHVKVLFYVKILKINFRSPIIMGLIFHVFSN